MRQSGPILSPSATSTTYTTPSLTLVVPLHEGSRIGADATQGEALGGEGLVGFGDQTGESADQHRRHAGRHHHERAVSTRDHDLGALAKGRILAGFAGSAADGLTLCDLLEAKLEAVGGNFTRACVELAKGQPSPRSTTKSQSRPTTMQPTGLCSPA